MFFWRLILPLAFLLLSACAGGPVKPDANSFTFQGLIGITTANQQQSANFKWREQAPSYEIVFYGPMGLGASTLTGDDQSAILTLSDGKTYRANDPEGLMDQVLGWSVPVQGLNYWLFAKAAPGGAASVSKNDQGQVTNLTQDGWQIAYTWNSGQNIPHKLVLTQKDISITIIINKTK